MYFTTKKQIIKKDIYAIQNIYTQTRVGKMPAFMSKVQAGGIYRYLPAFTGIYRRLLEFTGAY